MVSKEKSSTQRGVCLRSNNMEAHGGHVRVKATTKGMHVHGGKGGVQKGLQQGKEKRKVL